MPTKPAAKPDEADENFVINDPAPTWPRLYVKGSHTASVRADHDARRTALLARQEVAQAERSRLDDELADIDLALKLCSEPALESNVTSLFDTTGLATNSTMRPYP